MSNGLNLLGVYIINTYYRINKNEYYGTRNECL